MNEVIIKYNEEIVGPLSTKDKVMKNQDLIEIMWAYIAEGYQIQTSKNLESEFEDTK